MAWQTINFDDGPRSPFLISDETPHELRVENAPDKIDHANGITATGQVVTPASASVEQVRGWLLDAGVPPTLTVVRAQFLANVAIFVPAVALAVAAWPRLRWQDCVAYGFLASFGVEVAQALLLPDRVASTRDIAANTLGAAVGALVGVLLSRWRQRG